MIACESTARTCLRTLRWYIEAFSVHADRSELVDWIASARTQPVAVYLVHAEHDSASALKALIEGTLGIPVTVAEDDITVEVTAQVSD